MRLRTMFRIWMLNLSKLTRKKTSSYSITAVRRHHHHRDRGSELTSTTSSSTAFRCGSVNGKISSGGMISHLWWFMTIQFAFLVKLNDIQIGATFTVPIILTRPTCSASSSSFFSRASATSLAWRNSLAVGNPEILAFSSFSYFMRLSLGDVCDKVVEGLR